MSDDLFFTVSKVFWHALRPDNLLVAALVVGLWRVSPSLRRFWWLWNRGLAMFLLLLTFVPMGSLLLLPLERQFPPVDALSQKPDGIIVLSGGVTFGPDPSRIQVNDHGDRDVAFVRLARLYPHAKLVYSGGSSSLAHQEFKGADAAARLLQDMGLDLGRVRFEGASRNTYESAVLTRQVVNPNAGENWLLITSAYHMPRSVGLFCAQGWLVQAYPVDFYVGRNLKLYPDFAHNLERLVMAVKEWIGLITYWATGKIPSLLPDGCSGQRNRE